MTDNTDEALRWAFGGQEKEFPSPSVLVGNAAEVHPEMGAEGNRSRSGHRQTSAMIPSEATSPPG